MKRYQTVAPGVRVVREFPAGRRSSRRRASKVTVRALEVPPLERPAIDWEQIRSLASVERVAARMLRQRSDDRTIIRRVLRMTLPDVGDQLALVAIVVADGTPLVEALELSAAMYLSDRQVAYFLMDRRLATKPELVEAFQGRGYPMAAIELLFDT